MSYPARSWPAAFALGMLAMLPLVVVAQTQQFYRPPKLISMSKPTSTPGDGTVQLKVFIKPNGTAASATIEKSTNPADNAVAIAVAKNSKYRPGALDGKPGSFFYTMVLHFTRTSVTSGDSVTGVGVEQAHALIDQGKYPAAKAMLTTYLSSHPNDHDADVLLGVAEGFLDDPTAAAAAFDAAGTVPANYQVIAVKAYGDAALAALNAKNDDAAVSDATKAIALAPNAFNLLYLRGTAYANGQHFTQATADLEKAKSLAAADPKTDAKTRLLIDEALAQTYLLAGQIDKGIALAQDIKKRDAAEGDRLNDAIAAAYFKQAAAFVADGKRDAAVTAYESAATASPAHAAAFYYDAAQTLAGVAKPDWKSVRAEADKSLAADPTSARANYLAGVAAANAGDKPGAIAYLQKAKANVGTDSTLAVQVDAALKQLGQK